MVRLRPSCQTTSRHQSLPAPRDSTRVRVSRTVAAPTKTQTRELLTTAMSSGRVCASNNNKIYGLESKRPAGWMNQSEGVRYSDICPCLTAGGRGGCAGLWRLPSTLPRASRTQHHPRTAQRTFPRVTSTTGTQNIRHDRRLTDLLGRRRSAGLDGLRDGLARCPGNLRHSWSCAANATLPAS